MADIANIKPVERMIEIVHPATAQPVGLRVGVMAISDPRMKKIRRNIQDAKLRLEARGKNFKAEDVEENSNNLLFGAMTGWEWYNPTGAKDDKGYDADADMTYHGNKPEFTKPNVISVLTELEWVADQLSEAIADEKAFF